jgi:hypothetical protein
LASLVGTEYLRKLEQMQNAWVDRMPLLFVEKCCENNNTTCKYVRIIKIILSQARI